jgi:hypothetical protein
MSTFAVQAQRPLPQQITNLLKELHVIEHELPDPPAPEQPTEAPEREGRRQEIRRELVQIVNLLGWRQSYPLRLWMYGRVSKRVQ